MPNQGALGHILRTVLAPQGIDIEMQFLPWARAKRVAEQDPEMIGYFPPWELGIEDGFFGVKMVSSPVGFAQRAENPIEWSNLDDLTGLKIGYIPEYGNPEDFMARVDSGDIVGDAVPHDLNGLRMLSRGRLDAVLTDPYLTQFYLQNDSQLGQSDIEFNDRFLVEHMMYIAFEDTAENRERAKIVKEAFKDIDFEKMISEYINKI